MFGLYIAIGAIGAGAWYSARMEGSLILLLCCGYLQLLFPSPGTYTYSFSDGQISWPIIPKTKMGLLAVTATYYTATGTLRLDLADRDFCSFLL